ncbi:MAG TPA: A24 family peptidase [Acidimicrobiales bacterium]|nr:A24 family peptidase [Acidimicrobiales bacterium]
MSAAPELLFGALVGMATGAALIPLTRRELAAAIDRATDSEPGPPPAPTEVAAIAWHRLVLVLVSGLLPGIVIYRAGWSILAIPALVLVIGLVQLAYCDATKFLLPKTMVHATTASVAVSALIAAGVTGHWHRLAGAVLCSIGLFLLLLAINLMNPAWMAFGDVRLAPAVGLGLAWISPLALLQGFFLANILAAVVGLILMGLQRGSRKTALPFGLYLALASAVIVLLWS